MLRLGSYAKSDVSDKVPFNSSPQSKCVKCLLDGYSQETFSLMTDKRKGGGVMLGV